MHCQPRDNAQGVNIIFPMDSSSIDYRVHAAALAELANGPMAISELASRLRRAGVLDHLQGLDDERVALELDDVLLDHDDVWIVDDGTIASIARMLEGAHFSHSVSSSELEHGVLDVNPDLVALDFDADAYLSLTSGGELKATFKGESALGPGEFFVGPSGWLNMMDAPGFVVLTRNGETVSLLAGADLGRGDAEEEALRAAFDQHYIEGVLIDPVQIVLDALCRDPLLFRTPVVPLRELFERAGLECRGAWLARQGEDAQHPALAFHEHMVNDLSEEYDFDRCCRAAFDEVLDAWMKYVVDEGALENTHGTARALAHGVVAPAFAEYVLDNEDFGSDLLNDFATQLTKLGGKLRAPGHYLRALNAEREGHTLEAESALAAAIAADTEYMPALLELSWYAADRSDATRALSLLRRSGASKANPELQYLLSLDDRPEEEVGRNDPCPCGSGRKFKMCCINGRGLTIEERASWLCHKIAMFSFRPQNQWRLEELLDIATDAVFSDSTESVLPLVAELAAYERDALEEFIEKRGVLLTEEERALAHTWMGLSPTLSQVVAVEPGASITVFDTRTGENLVVTERSASQSVHVGDYLFTRIVPAGASWLITGEIVRVPLQHRESLMAILDAGAQVQDLAAWIGGLHRPVSLTNYENEKMVWCRAVLVPATDWKTLSGTLDRMFDETHDGEWTEFAEINSERVVRCALRRDDDALVVETNSVERFERVLKRLSDEFGPLDIIEEVRTDLSSTNDLADRSDANTLSSTNEDVPEEILEVVRNLMRDKEIAWLDESIPALAGLTPRQAAADPTRREDLTALLNEFDLRHTGDTSMETFDVSRLRRELGM